MPTSSRIIFIVFAFVILCASCIHASDGPMTKQKLVFIGDSLTEFFDWQKRFPDYMVANLGIAGERVEGLLNRRELIHARIKDPDCIFLMTGINDIINQQNDIMDPYRELVRNFTTWYKHSRLVVQSLLPVELWADNNTIMDINRRLKEIAREYNAEYLDIYSLFVDSSGKPKKSYFQEDGLHLNNKGYAVWASEVEKYLKKSNHGRS